MEDDGEMESPAAKTIEVSVEEALAHNRYPTAYALRTLFDENCHDAKFIDTVTDYIRQTGDPEAPHMKWFYKLMSERKEEGDKHDTAFEFFYGPIDARKGNVPWKPKVAEYGNLVRLDLSNNKEEILRRKRPEREQTPTASNDILETIEDESSSQPRKRIKTGASTAPVADAEMAPAEQPAAITKIKTPKRANGINGNAHHTPSSSRRHRAARGGSEESTSSLSTARSVSLPAEEKDDKQTTAAKRRRATGKKDAPIDVDDAESPPAFEFQHFPPAHGTIDPNDPKEVAKRASRGLTDAPPNPSAFRPPVADTAPQQDVEMIDAPVSSTNKRPTRAAAQRSTRAAAKRGAEDMSDDLPSSSGLLPAAESVQASRATTPGPRAAKKAKTSLRVKISYVLPIDPRYPALLFTLFHLPSFPLPTAIVRSSCR